MDLVIRSRRVVVPGAVRPADVCVRGDRIVEVAPYGSASDAQQVVDTGNFAVLPGGVDTHVHVNDPGTDWEGFPSATSAAAAGGFTTIVDMPLNNRPVTIDVPALDAKRAAADGRSVVDYGFWGGLVPGNRSELEPLVRAGVLGFKAFLVDSGRPDFPPIRADELIRGMAAIADLDVPLLVHAELPERVASHRPPGATGSRTYAQWLESRPPVAEAEAIELVVDACRETGCRAHVVHVSSMESLAVLGRARAEGLPITAETCPHYLIFSAAAIPDGATVFKCAPPIRDTRHREALWAGLEDGTLDLIASDHSPCPAGLRELESGDFFAAWGGIASLEVSLSATWTGASARGFSLDRLAQWVSTAPARLAGLESFKGTVAAGRDADLVVFDPEAELTVEASKLHHRHPYTPYDGLALRGRVMETYLRGEQVFAAGAVAAGRPGREVVRA